MQKAVFMIALLFVSLLLSGQSTNYVAIDASKSQVFIERIAKSSASMKTLQCSFTQKKTISVLSESVISKGKLLYKKDNKLSWEYSTPYLFVFAMNGDKVYIKNEKSTSLYDTKSNAVFKEISVLLVNSISGIGLIDPKKFDASFYENETYLKMELKTKNKTLKSMMSSISIYFDKSTYLVNVIEMKEPSGDLTTINFNDIVLNQSIGDEKFIVN
jgi:outer membrane lipoprotein-sorting protein